MARKLPRKSLELVQRLLPLSQWNCLLKRNRIALGDPAPDPTIGKRIAPSTGLILMDEKGNERSGYGIMKMDEESSRITVGLDSKKGTEGVILALDDEGRNGLVIPGEDRTIYLGQTNFEYWATKPYPKYNGLMIRSKDSLFVDIQ